MTASCCMHKSSPTDTGRVGCEKSRNRSCGEVCRISNELPKVAIEPKLAAQAHSRIGRSTRPPPLRAGNNLSVFVTLLLLLVSDHSEKRVVRNLLPKRFRSASEKTTTFQNIRFTVYPSVIMRSGKSYCKV